jgi:hypothetical protein
MLRLSSQRLASSLAKQFFFMACTQQLEEPPVGGSFLDAVTCENQCYILMVTGSANFIASSDLQPRSHMVLTIAGKAQRRFVA